MSKTSQSLAGKTAIVTGGSRSIGAAIAKRLAADGAHVAITYNASPEKADQVVKEITANGGKAFAVKADATAPEKLPAIIDEVIGRLGKLDILVNNAGVMGNGLIGEVDPAEFEKTLSVNVRAVFYATNAAVKAMNDNGRIINIGSGLGERAIMAGISTYNMTKFAVNGLARSWAHDLAPRGITVNTVQPGPIDTDMNPASGEFADAMTQMVPLKRYGKADEIASTVAFLAGDESAYVTGAVINVDGGINA